MQDEHALTPAQRELELALKSVTPTAARVDSAAAAFSAGRRSARRRARFWQSAAFVLLLAAAGSWLVPARHIADLPSDRSGLMVVDAHPPSPVRPLSDQSLFILQAAVREKGVDGLPATDVPPVYNVQTISTF